MCEKLAKCQKRLRALVEQRGQEQHELEQEKISRKRDRAVKVVTRSLKVKQ